MAIARTPYSCLANSCLPCCGQDKKVTCPGLHSVDLDLESDSPDIVNSFLCRHPAVKEISLRGLLTDILRVIHTLSNLSTINLKKLCLLCTDEDECEDKRFDELTDFVLHNQHMETLVVHCDGISDDVIKVLLSFNDIVLKYLSLNNCSRITKGAFSGIDRLTSLVSLSLDNTNADDIALDQIARNCPRLQRLSVQGCALVTDVGFAHVADHCGELRDLIVNSLEMHSTPGRNITDNGLMSLARGCPRLKCLVINKCPGVGSTGLIEIAEQCRDLEEIQVAECLSVTDASVIAFAKNCLSLRIVNLNSCLQITSEAVNKLVVTCKHLYSLQLETCRFMSKLKFDDIVTNTDNSGFDQSPVVNVNNDIGTDDKKGVHDNLGTPFQSFSDVPALQKDSLMKQNDAIETAFDFQDPRNAVSSDYGDTCIRYEAYNNVTPSIFVTRKREMMIPTDSKQQLKKENILSQNVPEPQITLDTQKSDTCSNQHKLLQISVPDFDSVSSQHSHLRVLHLGFSSSLTDTSLRQIGRHCPDLVDLSIRGCHSLSDSSVRFLLQKCRHLRTLDISGGSAVKATNLTDSCLLAVAEFSTMIKKLFIMKNDLITADAVKIVLQKCRHIDTLYVSCSKNSAITPDNTRAMVRTTTRRVSVTMENHFSTKSALVFKCLE
ncbi:uncharacterized protein LOC132553322 [Ylistrum balloti]|uniref:uncharacterized protein LOC132553322 n=1 Tax=Ylistrum balloti TaxID=509963 RepID=UPI0029058CFA|nr:uncharacterized protein LOC132553322 [Ylistrum balloti]